MSGDGNITSKRLSLKISCKEGERLAIELDLPGGKTLVFASWAELYYYLAQRYPERPSGYLR